MLSRRARARLANIFRHSFSDSVDLLSDLLDCMMCCRASSASGLAVAVDTESTAGGCSSPADLPPWPTMSAAARTRPFITAVIPPDVDAFVLAPAIADPVTVGSVFSAAETARLARRISLSC